MAKATIDPTTRLSSCLVVNTNHDGATCSSGDDYSFPKLRNQLRGVTLNDKVKLHLVLIGSPAIEYLLYGVWR